LARSGIGRLPGGDLVDLAQEDLQHLTFALNLALTGFGTLVVAGSADGSGRAGLLPLQSLMK